MKLFKSLVLGMLICLLTISCSKEENITQNTFEVTGTIQKLEATAFQYGTHTISGFALRSSSVNLDDYINQSVTIVGYKIDGYPVDGGPDYIEVEQLKQRD